MSVWDGLGCCVFFLDDECKLCCGNGMRYCF